MASSLPATGARGTAVSPTARRPSPGAALGRGDAETSLGAGRRPGRQRRIFCLSCGGGPHGRRKARRRPSAAHLFIFAILVRETPMMAIGRLLVGGDPFAGAALNSFQQPGLHRKKITHSRSQGAPGTLVHDDSHPATYHASGWDALGLLGLCTLTDCCVFCCRSWTAVRHIQLTVNIHLNGDCQQF